MNKISLELCIIDVEKKEVDEQEVKLLQSIKLPSYGS